ncbi:MAG: formate/nitrite transporter family protein [Pseudomonadota bacterium]|uniref:Formate/nitrite family of transporter n=2 Tax=Methylophaga TaxID=40222 RepID=F5SZS8_9GAMM|nr:MULTISPECIES: formate/nitrite transporter family protein [Methylophaga]EGL54678.1 formate/nitrite family of transporter [Methylophaga aminisulfidivorans MP]MEC9411637.1 formate/nitrite transporter family protein [Pseudomonadota bacterium]GLQ01027.1 formate transporter [Methylophaga thalassica]
MSYISPGEFVKTMVDAGESKLFMATRDVLIRSFMAGAILAIAVALAVTAAVQTGIPIVGALIFPVGFCILNLLGFDLLTGVFALVPLALFDKRPGATFNGLLKNWGLVALGNLLGALTTAVLIGIAWTFAFTTEPGAAGQAIAKAAEARTLGFAEHGAAGWLTVFVKGILCNWMVSVGVVGAMLSKDVIGKVIAMWMPILIFFGLVFEHAVVNMYLFPLGMMMGAPITIADWLIWNEIPVILGNLVGGLLLTGMVLYATHLKPGPTRSRVIKPDNKVTAN